MKLYKCTTRRFMKTEKILLPVLFGITASVSGLLAPTIALGQTLGLDWISPAASGDSKGGDFLLASSIGRTDAGEMAGGVFVFTGGFFAATLTGGQPTLEFDISGGSLILSWPVSAADFSLESRGQLSS